MRKNITDKHEINKKTMNLQILSVRKYKIVYLTKLNFFF